MTAFIFLLSFLSSFGIMTVMECFFGLISFEERHSSGAAGVFLFLKVRGSRQQAVEAACFYLPQSRDYLVIFSAVSSERRMNTGFLSRDDLVILFAKGINVLSRSSFS